MQAAFCIIMQGSISTLQGSMKSHIQSVLRASSTELEVTWAIMSYNLTIEDHEEALSGRGCQPAHLVTATGLFNFLPYVAIVNII